jgi:hypothetical protein
MTTRKNFDARYVDDQLRLVSEKLGGKTTMYVAGGTVMAVRNLKEGTKDIDVVVESADEPSHIPHWDILSSQEPRRVASSHQRAGSARSE